MANITQAADHLRGLYDRTSVVLNSQGWSNNFGLNSIQGYQPAYPVSTVLDYIKATEQRVRQIKPEDIDTESYEKSIADIPDIVTAVQVQHIPNDPLGVINSLMTTLHMVNARLPTNSRGPIKLDWESVEDKTIFPRDIARRLRSIDIRLTALEPRASEIESKISDIEAAHETAEQLPEDLAELAAKREEVAKIFQETQDLLDKALKVGAKIEGVSDDAISARRRMTASLEQADRLVERSEQALRGSTGVGLANAFEKRHDSLQNTGGFWVVGLVVALLAAVGIGAWRVWTLQNLLNNESSPQIVWMNVILSIFGIGGPIWFAWLSTKQIAVNFKLAEDYAFKAAVSKAYEGYRKEAVEVDPALKARLFATALDRLEEAPIRLMDKETHSSPIQELLSNPAMRKSLEGVPGIAEKIIALIPGTGGVAAVVGSTAAVAAAVSETTSKPKPRAEEEE